MLPKKVSSDFSYTLTYLTLKYERNRIFHPCRGILILSDFYRQALLNTLAQDKTISGSCYEGINATSNNFVFSCPLKPLLL